MGVPSAAATACSASDSSSPSASTVTLTPSRSARASIEMGCPALAEALVTQEDAAGITLADACKFLRHLGVDAAGPGDHNLALDHAASIVSTLPIAIAGAMSQRMWMAPSKLGSAAPSVLTVMWPSASRLRWATLPTAVIG